MPNPFEAHDGKRKYVFSKDGEHFYLRVCTSLEAIQKCASGIALEFFVTYGADLSVREDVRKIGEDLRYEPKPYTLEELNECLDKKLPSFFAADNPKNSGRTIFFLENAEGRPVCSMWSHVNNAPYKEALHLGNPDENFFYVGSAYTDCAEKYRGKGLFSAMFDQIILSLPSEETRTRYVICMMNYQTVKRDEAQGDTFHNHVAQHDKYGEMWKKRFEEGSIQMQLRERYGPGLGIAIKGDIPYTEKLDAPTLEALSQIQNMKDLKPIPTHPTSGAEFSGAGLFLHGISTQETEEKLRVVQFTKLNTKGFAFHKPLDKSWEVAQEQSETAESIFKANLAQPGLSIKSASADALDQEAQASVSAAAGRAP